MCLLLHHTFLLLYGFVRLIVTCRCRCVGGFISCWVLSSFACCICCATCLFICFGCVAVTGINISLVERSCSSISIIALTDTQRFEFGYLSAHFNLLFKCCLSFR